MNGFQVLRRHYIFIVDFQFGIAFLVFNRVRTSAILKAGTAVGRTVVIVQAQVALAAHGHTQCPVNKYLDLNQFAFGSPDILFANLTGNRSHLNQCKFPGSNHYIGITRIKFHRRNVGNIALRRNMNFETLFFGIFEYGKVGRDDGRHTVCFGSIDGALHFINFVVKNYSIHR